MKLIICWTLLLLAFSSLVRADPRTLEGDEIRGWLNEDFAGLVELVLGQEGGQIFPLWNRESGVPVLDGILVTIPTVIDVGLEAPARLEIYLEAATLKPRSLVFELENPLDLDQIATYFGDPFELRACRPRDDPDALEVALEVAPEGTGTLSLAIFPEIRLVAGLFEPNHLVSRLRWVAPTQSLDGCP